MLLNQTVEKYGLLFCPFTRWILIKIHLFEWMDDGKKDG